MTWSSSISTEISSMFSEYSWHADEMLLALNKRAAEKRARDCEYAATYRERLKFRPARRRALLLWKREYMREYERRQRQEPESRAIRNKRAREGMKRLWERRQEEKRKNGLAPSASRQCTACGVAGHNVRTCAVRRAA